MKLNLLLDDRITCSDYRDHGAGGATVDTAIMRSPYRPFFQRGAELFAAKLNRHERMQIKWWHAPYVYVEVTDVRLSYPESVRALVSFDLTNGRWASDLSECRYVLTRHGWGAFMDRLLNDDGQARQVC